MDIYCEGVAESHEYERPCRLVTPSHPALKVCSLIRVRGRKRESSYVRPYISQFAGSFAAAGEFESIRSLLSLNPKNSRKVGRTAQVDARRFIWEAQHLKQVYVWSISLTTRRRHNGGGTDTPIP